MGDFGRGRRYVICAFKLSDEHTVVGGVDMEDTVEEGAEVRFGLLDLHATGYVVGKIDRLGNEIGSVVETFTGSIRISYPGMSWMS